MVRLKIIPQLWDSSSTSVFVPQKEVCHEPKDPDKHDGDIEQVWQIILVSNHLTYTTIILFFMWIFIVAEVYYLCDANKTNSMEILRWKTTFWCYCYFSSMRKHICEDGVQNSQESEASWRDKPLSPHAGVHMSNQQRLVGTGRAQGNGDINWGELITPLTLCGMQFLQCFCLHSMWTVDRGARITQTKT